MTPKKAIEILEKMLDRHVDVLGCLDKDPDMDDEMREKYFVSYRQETEAVRKAIAALIRRTDG